MDYLGLLALGGFVGAIATYGLRFIESFETFAKALTTIFTAVLSGTVILFLDRFTNVGKALGAYSVGLLLALMWAYVGSAVDNIGSKNASLRLLGWGHIFGVVIVSIVAAALVLPPAFREVWAKAEERPPIKAVTPN